MIAGKPAEQGSILARTLIALALSTLVIGGTIKVASGTAVTSNRVINYVDLKKSIADISRVAKKTAHDCSAPFIPSRTIFGSGNASSPPSFDPKWGPLPGNSPAATEADLYCQDGQHHETFLAFLYDAPSGSIREYQYVSRDASGAATGLDTTPIATWNGPFNYFSASYLNASAIANGNAFVAQAVTQQGDVVADKLVNLGYPEVFAGNRMVVMAFGTASGLFGKVELTPRTFPDETVVRPLYAPGHQPMTVAPNALYFQYGNPTTQSFTAQDPNFKANFVATNGCGASAALAGGGNGPSANFDATVNVTSLGVPPFNCTVSVDTYDHSVPTQTLTLFITPTGALIDRDPNIAFATPVSPAVPVRLHEDYYFGGPVVADATTPRPDGLQACGNAVTIDGGLGGSKPVNGTFDTAFSIAPNTPNSITCAVHFSDDHGGTAWTAVGLTGSGALAVSPSSVTMSVGAQQNVTITETNYAGPFTYTTDCGGAVTFSPASGAIGGPSAQLQLTSTATKNCNLVVNDNHNNDRGSPAGPITVPISITGNLQAIFVCDPQSPARPRGTDIGPDPDGVHEDVSDGTTCAGPTPTPSPTPAAQLVEVQQWTSWNSPPGNRASGWVVDSELFLLYNDGSVGMGAPGPGTTWTCPAPQGNAGPPGSGWSGWPGFVLAPSNNDVSLGNRWDVLFSEANGTGNDGWMTLTDRNC